VIDISKNKKEELSKMEKKIIAEQLLKLAKTLIAAEEPEEVEEVKKAEEKEEEGSDEINTLIKKQDPTLTSIVNKINAAVGDDLPRLLTAVLMVMRKNKHNQEASQLFNMFKPIIKRVAK
jgi:hypothetical protein